VKISDDRVISNGGYRPLFSRDGKVLEFKMASMKLNAFILAQLRAAASPRDWIESDATRGMKKAER
jgi:hypothetical protein